MAKKAISVCTDAENRITGLCLDDLSGCTDWRKTTVQALCIDMGEELFDDHGACRYRLEDGRAVPRSEAERQADWPEEEPEPQDEAAALRQQVDMLTECLLEMSEEVYK